MMQYLTKQLITQKTDASSPTRARSGQLSSVEFFASLVAAISSRLCYAHKNASAHLTGQRSRSHSTDTRRCHCVPIAHGLEPATAQRRTLGGGRGLFGRSRLGARSDRGLRLREMTQIACTGSGGTPTSPTNFTGIYGQSSSGGSGRLPQDQQISVRPGSDSVLAPVRASGPAIRPCHSSAGLGRPVSAAAGAHLAAVRKLPSA